MAAVVGGFLALNHQLGLDVLVVVLRGVAACEPERYVARQARLVGW